ELKKIADSKKAQVLQRFFKTGKGEYGEEDIFLGITVPISRKIANKYKDLDFAGIEELLHSGIHEERLIALLILVRKFLEGSDPLKKKIYEFYLSNTKYINNWDLVDLSAPKIIGEYLFARQPRVSDDARLRFLKKQSLNSASLSKIRHPSEQKPNFNSSESGLPRMSNALLNLAKSESIWERRIAVLATFQFIKNNQFDNSLEIAKMLLGDKHDLVHKAVGWMLREMGKRDLEIEIEFLNKHSQEMPRTMLRYAIEKFPENLRLIFLKK
ncbi:MAG TPA: DNA alkylation repair protein, partial [Candidatus Nanoarchaeia archaeon]|nr:DNA alkylation repair protein [Candidatus Nanoarchaeia archaeon]